MPSAFSKATHSSRSILLLMLLLLLLLLLLLRPPRLLGMQNGEALM